MCAERVFANDCNVPGTSNPSAPNAVVVMLSALTDWTLRSDDPTVKGWIEPHVRESPRFISLVFAVGPLFFCANLAFVCFSYAS